MRSGLGCDACVGQLSNKRDMDDTRESLPGEIMEFLTDLGAEVIYSDPFVSSFPAMRRHSFELPSVDLTPDTIASYD
jgi:UDP-N-acetyl-D-glucosamine dehydrogenase